MLSITNLQTKLVEHVVGKELEAGNDSSVGIRPLHLRVDNTRLWLLVVWGIIILQLV